jgi:hypothetical protein
MVKRAVTDLTAILKARGSQPVEGYTSKWTSHCSQWNSGGVDMIEVEIHGDPVA